MTTPDALGAWANDGATPSERAARAASIPEQAVGARLWRLGLSPTSAERQTFPAARWQFDGQPRWCAADIERWAWAVRRVHRVTAWAPRPTPPMFEVPVWP